MVVSIFPNARKPISVICFVAALGALISVPVALPPWANFWKSELFIEVPNDRLYLVFWALAIAAFLVFLGFVTLRTASSLVDNTVLLLATLAAFVLVDRVLLSQMPRNIFVHDVATYYRYRPNSVRIWPEEFGHKVVRINAYGYHDDPFPMEKGQSEFRAVMLGDSVTMGHGVTLQETFANRLEEMINENRPETCGSQIINAGVQGYATYQEYVTFGESLKFSPEFAALGFVLNDVSEPWLVDRKFGGVGTAYNSITQAESALTGYLLNDTGFGRMARTISTRSQTKEEAWRAEIFNAERVARGSFSDPNLIEAWAVVKDDLARVYALANRENIPFLLLIFPFTFQFLDQDSKLPQMILKQHAAENNIDYIDFTEIFEGLIFEDLDVQALRQNSRSLEEIRKSQNEAVSRYFLDADHLTPEGHKVVARELYSYLVSAGLFKPDSPSC